MEIPYDRKNTIRVRVFVNSDKISCGTVLYLDKNKNVEKEFKIWVDKQKKRDIMNRLGEDFNYGYEILEEEIA